MKLFFDINIKTSFDERDKNLLDEILGSINQMSDKVSTLADKVSALEKAEADSRTRTDTRIQALQQLLDEANAQNAKMDADLSPLVDRITALIDAENAQSPATAETPPTPETPAQPETPAATPAEGTPRVS